MVSVAAGRRDHDGLNALKMIRTQCAICDTDAWDRLLYETTLDFKRLSFECFSARRIPDRVHYRTVVCRKCGLIRADPILSDCELERLYGASTFTYEREAPYTLKTYARYFREILHLTPDKSRLLEIGCGNGFFLAEALACGFTEVYGVEPSSAAVEQASPLVRGGIQVGVLKNGLFPDGHFSMICGFQVLDHVADPNVTLSLCRRLLRPGGLAFFIHHDAGAWTHRFLGESSPIFDVEHVYLFNRSTVRRIFIKNGFQSLRVFPVANTYPLYYWFHLMPLPSVIKQAFLPRLRASSLGGMAVRLRAGNLGIVARRGDDA